MQRHLSQASSCMQGFCSWSATALESPVRTASRGRVRTSSVHNQHIYNYIFDSIISPVLSLCAASVNLEPSDVPQDVYSDVAVQVEVFRRQDARRGSRVAQVLEGFVTRKVVKQTVMTVVYGVTRFGGRLQIEKRIRELSDFPQEFLWDASHYLVRQVFRSLQEMFSGSRAIQHWLTESARLISHMGSAVEWVTPLGIPIIQPYHQEIKVKQGGRGLQSVSYSVNADSSLKPNKLKQKNGFPPNFIHSLDSTHMMLTALHCYREGLTFVSVHDCFWTHAAHVPIMNQVCREQFVRLHSQQILQDLSTFLVSRFCCKGKFSWAYLRSLF
ncbi:hypothetical protein P7K49_039448 [Saguinus oedipus]|uniref:DNA-directed RNA polymerase n=1 Tax=Saguinus oedipus TaxID=9490 RepID=A0ABQ9TCS6_SAGOE|nr:hypothetical protein P7K49_039448 [Saguinus oedipus]